jgi:hypothetical protein
MNAKDKFINHAIDFVLQNHKPFRFRDFTLLGYSHHNFNQLVNRCKDDILKIGKDKYFPKGLLKSNTLYSSISDNSQAQTCQKSILNDPDLLLYFLGQNIHNIRSNFKKVNGIYSNLHKQGYEPEPTPLHEIKLDPEIINYMDIQIYVYPTDTVKIIIGCSSDPILLSHSDIDKLIKTYEQIRQKLLAYSSCIPTLDYMRITQFDYAIDAIYYKVGNFNQIGLEFPTFNKSLAKVYYPENNKIRFEQPNISNIDLSINNLQHLVDTILPINFNALTPISSL